MVAALVILAVAGACLWQEARYLRLRRDVVQDRQALLHGDVFHVVTFLQIAPGADLFAALRRLRDTAEAGGQQRGIPLRTPTWWR